MIRDRTAADLPALALALRRVHDRDAYPSVWPDDPAAFLNPPGTLGAWVAGPADHVLGHVLLRALPDVLPAWAEVTGQPATELAVVSRLFVVPEGRGVGLARSLFHTAWAQAVRLNRRAVLDVHLRNHAAIRLYDRSGWEHVATVEGDWRDPDGSVPLVRVYMAPE
ncbi:ribosomal protein S18 acetylase RimI-like enzyme [Deinococcus metalli]|uniref:GNAT family N-acetyltransferase n=1 Tax=Deinococcus metalli TaxID=1141878 RepID=A0A7W8KFJ5_9DEIO|nr:GNAT family N-acetyltransferase [Deinococcus metalli]MBB5377275.1 ribosomal protein S18 acetylase RimI-like enzyme [Deinococcus metalli]GHF47701.1 GNAT family N-acetyltransferase [Deinococcus metalli]